MRAIRKLDPPHAGNLVEEREHTNILRLVVDGVHHQSRDLDRFQDVHNCPGLERAGDREF